MRVYGRWRADYDAAFVSALLSSTTLGILEEEVDFLIDTGAIRTMILYRDAKCLGLDFNRLHKQKYKMTGIGGSVETYAIEETTLIFSTDKGTKHLEKLEVLVLKHTKVDEKIERLPSLLGRDIIGKHHLIYSKPTRRVYLTDEEIHNSTRTGRTASFSH